jgi:hypothetical protein
MPASSSVISVLLRALGDFSLHPQGRPCGRPPAAAVLGRQPTTTGGPTRRGCVPAPRDQPRSAEPPRTATGQRQVRKGRRRPRGGAKPKHRWASHCLGLAPSTHPHRLRLRIESSAAAPPNGGLPTRLVVTEDDPHPSPSWWPSPPGSELHRPRRPCPPRAPPWAALRPQPGRERPGSPRTTTGIPRASSVQLSPLSGRPPPATVTAGSLSHGGSRVQISSPPPHNRPGHRPGGSLPPGRCPS